VARFEGLQRHYTPTNSNLWAPLMPFPHICISFYVTPCMYFLDLGGTISTSTYLLCCRLHGWVSTPTPSPPLPPPTTDGGTRGQGGTARCTRAGGQDVGMGRGAATANMAAYRGQRRFGSFAAVTYS